MFCVRLGSAAQAKHSVNTCCHSSRPPLHLVKLPNSNTQKKKHVNFSFENNVGMLWEPAQDQTTFFDPDRCGTGKACSVNGSALLVIFRFNWLLGLSYI